MPPPLELLRVRTKLIISCSISCIFVFLTQFSLTLIPHYLPSSSLLAQLSLSALLLLLISGLGNNCRRLLQFYASAPAFVFFNILFIWGTYIILIQKDVSFLWSSIVFNVECVLLIFGLYSIVNVDPGMVAYGDAILKELYQDELSGFKSYTEEEGLLNQEACLEPPVVKMDENGLPVKRIRYCKYCKAYTKGYDHHCPAFGNCIGEKNHLLFVALLVGFIMVESSYVVCSTQFITASLILDKAMLESNLSGYLVISTRLFSILQVIWQVVFLTWHIYCVCVNIRTDEWINWKKYPEFHNSVHQSGQSRFKNPYDKGVLGNIKEFLSLKE